MVNLNMGGRRLDAVAFIDIYREVRKLSPPRYMTMRICPERLSELNGAAAPEESIQIGLAPGPLGRRITRVVCVKPPIGVDGGVEVIEDKTMLPTRIVFEIHGIPELVVDGLAQ